MDAKQFLAEFGHIVSAPEGVQRVREMIYNLAITGDLTEQLTEDGDAKSLLEDIEETKQHLIKEKKFKRTAKLESAPLDIPGNIKLPASWCWTRLLDIGEIGPRNEAEDEELAAFIPMSGIPDHHKGMLHAELKSWGNIKKGFTHFANGDVVVAKITPCFENGKAAVISGLDNEKGIGAGTTELHVFRSIHPKIHPGYIYIFLRSPFFVVEGIRNMTGTAGQKRLPMDYFATRVMPWPPFKEQERIVAKIDELMALCDKVEKQQYQRCKLEKNVRLVLLQNIINTTEPNELKSSWEKVSGDFGHIVSAPEGVQRVREMIYNLAITGDLTEQLTEDGDAKSLLEDIEETKQHLIKEKKFKRTAKLESAPLDIPGNIKLPASWCWTRLLDIGEIGPRNEAEDEELAAFIPMSGIPDHHKGMLHAELKSWGNIKKGFTHFANGDVVVAKITPCFENGKAAVISGLDNEKGIGAGTTELHVFRSIHPKIHPGYIYIFLRSPFFVVEGIRNMTGTAGQKRLPMDYFATRVMPWPPFKEQERIVAKIDELMALCDKVEKHLKHSSLLAQRLAFAATAAITGIHREEVEIMKIPKTQLISKLRIGISPTNKDQALLAAILVHHNNEMDAHDLWQRYGGEIDAFYRQLKIEVEKGWILEPEEAEMREVEAG